MIHALGLGYFFVRFRLQNAIIGSVSANFPGLLSGYYKQLHSRTIHLMIFTWPAWFITSSTTSLAPNPDNNETFFADLSPSTDELLGTH